MSGLTQSILVVDGGRGSVAQVCRAVANASFESFDDRITDPAAWDAWFGGGAFTKVTRVPRTEASLNRALESSEHRSCWSGPVQAFAFVPMTREGTPSDISKARVAGLVREDVDAHWDVFGVREHSISVADYLEMSAGKMAAQVAHAVMLLRSQYPDVGRDWSLCRADERTMTIRARRSPVVIRDAGRTEIAPGSLTAVGC